MSNPRTTVAWTAGLIVLMLGLLLTLAGCGRAQSSATPSQREAASPTSTSIPHPTQSLLPTATPQNPIVSPTPTAEATLDVVATIVATGEPDVLQSHLSPDGVWRVDILTYPCIPVADGDVEKQRAERLILVDMRTAEEAVIQTQVSLCGDALGAVGLGGLFWSPDSRIFYTTDAREGVSDGGGGTCSDPSLWSLTAAGARIERLAGIWARSKAGDQLAFLEARDIVVRRLDGEELTRVSLRVADAETCEIIWSSDENAFVYLQSPDPFTSSPVTLTCVDVAAGSSTLLFELEDVAWPALTWDAPDELVLSGFQDGEPREWLVEETCPTDTSAVVAPPAPADVAVWDTYHLADVGITLPVPPNWVITEWDDIPSILSSVSFQPPLWDTAAACGYQCPAISATIYPDVAGHADQPEPTLQAWFDLRQTTEPFGTVVENDTVVYFGVDQLTETTMGGRSALAFTHDAMGIRNYTTITRVDGVVIDLSRSHVGQFEFEPIYEVMRAHVTFGAEPAP